jgi:hypothetical protein
LADVGPWYAASAMFRNVTIKNFLQWNGGTRFRMPPFHRATACPIKKISGKVAWVILSWQNISFNKKCWREIGFLGATFWWKSTFPAVGICRHHFISINVSYYSCYYNTIALYSVTFVMSRVWVKRCDETPALIFILHAPVLPAAPG